MFPAPARPPSSRLERLALLVAGLVTGLVTGLALLAMSAPPAAAAPAPASSTAGSNAAPTPADLRWSLEPATADGPDARVSLRHVLDPGAAASDAVALTNLGAESATFHVETGDGVVGAGGAFDIVAGEGSGTWVALAGLDAAGDLTLAAGETRVLPVTIAVPADALPGDHPAGIVAAVSHVEAGTTVTHRIGVRVHLRVAGTVEPALVVDEVTTRWEPSWLPFAPGTLHVDYTVSNPGNARLGAAAVLDAVAPRLAHDDASATTSTSPIAEVLPGTTASGSLAVDLWPTVLASGELVVTPLAVGQDALTAPAPLTESVRAFTPSWTGLALVLLIAALVVVGLRRRRRGKITA